MQRPACLAQADTQSPKQCKVARLWSRCISPPAACQPDEVDEDDSSVRLGDFDVMCLGRRGVGAG